jgi:hypothetical protein
MRGLSHLATLVHRFLTYLSRACKSRLSKKTHQEILGFPVSDDVLCAGLSSARSTGSFTACAYLRELLICHARN